jgi:hypothetical protein
VEIPLSKMRESQRRSPLSAVACSSAQPEADPDGLARATCAMS